MGSMAYGSMDRNKREEEDWLRVTSSSKLLSGGLLQKASQYIVCQDY